MKEAESLEEIINHGLSSLEGDIKVTMDLQDFVFIYKTVEELRRFFHNREHYSTINEINEYISGEKGGMYSILNDIYIRKMDKYLSPEIEEIIESDELNSSKLPFYYKKIR